MDAQLDFIVACALSHRKQLDYKIKFARKIDILLRDLLDPLD